MCGIAGMVSLKHDSRALAATAQSLHTLAHRGPDDQGWQRHSSTSNENLYSILFHRRLAILDLSESGRQPMGTDDGQYSIVFNGEIYNYLELRRELQRIGVAFRSSTDTEVLLQAYVHWGPACLNRLVGMFALAILDRPRQILFLARDFFGIKPLYHATSGECFVFASEIKALLDFPQVSHEVEPQKLYEYLCFGRTDAGPDTMLKGIRQVQPGHYLKIPLSGSPAPTPVCYWKPGVADRLDLSFHEAANTLRELFLDSVRLHLRSDVPVGAALSGGIDSSAVVAAMRVAAPHADLHTFSFVADDPALNEESWVDQAGHHAGAAMEKIHLTPEELAADLDQLVCTQDEPFGSTSIYAQYRVYQRARQAGIKVMLDGQGADELLAGYRPYLAARAASLLREGHWRKALRFLRRAGRLPGSGGALRLLLQLGTLLFHPGWKTMAHQFLGRQLMPEWLNARWFDRYGFSPLSFQSKAGRDVLRDQLAQALAATSLPMLLRYQDRNSMAFSIESRVPFLTPRLAEFILALPEQHLIARDGTSKNVFRAAMRGLVPDAILNRRDKIGFATPERKWLTALRPWVDATLGSDMARSIPAINLKAMRRNWHEVLANRKRFDFRIWRWVNLIRWAERFQVKFGA